MTVASAGSQPKPVHPNAIRALREQGIDISYRRSRHLVELDEQRFDYVVSMCDRLRETCPEFPGHPELIHWSIPDSASGGSRDADNYPAFCELAADLRTRIAFLLARISDAAAG